MATCGLLCVLMEINTRIHISFLFLSLAQTGLSLLILAVSMNAVKVIFTFTAVIFMLGDGVYIRS